MKKTMMAAAFAMFAALPVAANTFVDAKIAELSAAGYTHFEVSVVGGETKIEAYAPDNSKIELFLLNSDGTVTSTETSNEGAGAYERHVADIEDRADDHGTEVEDEYEDEAGDDHGSDSHDDGDDVEDESDDDHGSDSHDDSEDDSDDEDDSEDDSEDH